MGLQFETLGCPHQFSAEDWKSWSWQMRKSLKSAEDFTPFFDLSVEEVEGFSLREFRVQTTPYYAYLAQENPSIRRIIVPTAQEADRNGQHLFDPLAERRHQPVSRIIHRYADRVLFLVTDMCGVYCRYCTRKHFTGGEQSLLARSEYDEALNYLKKNSSVKEVILSGGDPLTLANSVLDRILHDLRAIPHIEIIRIGSRMPVVNPMRIDEGLLAIVKKNKPVFFMVHFNHPKEISAEAAASLESLVDNGTPVFNQMVLLNGINNHFAIVRALSRRLLYLRAKPYYMFQCDPSQGTEHLRIPIEESENIQSKLWGHMSGLAMPNLSLDIPDGGGKAPIVPRFELEQDSSGRIYRGFDGVERKYLNPQHESVLPSDVEEYIDN